MSDCLLLNSDYAPLRVIAWERAVVLLLTERAMSLAGYPGRQIRSPSISIPWPAVVRLVNYASARPRTRFSRTSVLARDEYTCQYCGITPRTREGRANPNALTLDHVVPRSRSRDGFVTVPWNTRKVPVTTWENVVTCCKECNRRKGSKTPEECGLALRAIPRRPGPYDAVRIALGRSKIPEEWKEWLPSR